MTIEQAIDKANAIYLILMEECGAPDRLVDDFIYRVARQDPPTTEYRFQGDLGFGGKYYPKRNRVSCYPEDETPERLKMIARCNDRLLREEGVEG